MRSLLKATILIAGLLIAAGIASAAEDNWRARVDADDGAGSQKGSYAHLGAYPTSVDGVDGQDQDAIYTADVGQSTRWVVGVIQGDNDTWTRDIYSPASPMTYPSQTKTWYLRVAALPNADDLPIRLVFSTLNASVLPPESVGGQDVCYKLVMADNKGKPGAPANGTTWDLPMPTSHVGEFWTIPVNLPILKLSEPTHAAMISEGYVLYFQQICPGPPPTVATPTFSPDGGTYTSAQDVTVSCATSGATIHYSTTGIDPTEGDPTVASGGTVNVAASLTLKAKAWKTGYTPSAVKSATYTINVTDTSDDIIGLASDGSIWYTTDKTTWDKIPGRLSSLAIGDMDGDGSDDIAGLSSVGAIWYTTDRSAWTNVPGRLSTLAVGDLNGDASDDLVGLSGTGAIWYTVDKASWTRVPGCLCSLAAGDFNADEADDIVGLSYDGSIWLTTNKTTWTKVPGCLSSAAVGDFNGDGYDDIAGLGYDGRIWYTTDKSTWTNIPGRLASITPGDFDGDGDDDIAGLGANGAIWYTTSKAGWTNIPGALSALVAGDWDGDGDDDIAGLSANGKIWYTTNKTSWTNIPGALSSIYRMRW